MAGRLKISKCTLLKNAQCILPDVAVETGPGYDLPKMNQKFVLSQHAACRNMPWFDFPCFQIPIHQK